MLNIPLTDLYFHKDYDGVVAAAMVYSSLSTPPRLHEMQYSSDLHWLSRDLGEFPGVVDFLFHPSAKLWIDHHSTTFLDEKQATEFVSDAYHVLDQTSPSCPEIIQRLPWFFLTEHWMEYVRWSNIIDSAQYSSPAEANEVTNPHLMLSRLIAELHGEAVFVQLIRGIAERSVDEVLRIECVRAINDSLVKRETEMRDILLRSVRVFGKVSILDQSSHHVAYHRYIAYERYPHVNYGIGIYDNGSGFVVSVGENPWNRRGVIDLGALCKEYGGGGRKNTAGVPVNSAEKGRALAKLLCNRLNSVLA